MKIGIVNQPLGNRGDESAHKALVRALLKSSKIDIIDVIFLNVHDENIEDIQVKNNKVNYINLKGINKASNMLIKKTLYNNNILFSQIHPLLRKYILTISKYDCIICAPGGICMGGFMNWTHVWQLYIAMKQNKKIFYWGRSIGPFSDETLEENIFKKVSLQLLNYFDYISLRDELSCELAKDLGIHYNQTVDSAFLEKINVSIPNKIISELDDNNYIVFVPNQLTWHYKYANLNQEIIDNFYLSVINKLNKIYPKSKIVMLPQTCKTNINDYKYFNKLKLLSKYSEKIIVIDENQSSDIQQSIIKNACFLVGARYHSVIFAINNSIPFLSLSYEHKMRGILKTLNLNKYQIDIEKMFLEKSNIDLDVMDTLLKENHILAEKMDKATSLATYMASNAFNNMLLHLD